MSKSKEFINNINSNNDDAKCQNEQVTKIEYENENFYFQLVTFNEILQISLFKENDIDKFKNFFTYERLHRRCRAISLVASNTLEAAEQIFSAVQNNNYTLKVNSSKSYLIIIISFPSKMSKDNDKRNKDDSTQNTNQLEIFLYKTDSKQFDGKITNLKNQIELLNVQNEDIRSQNSTALLELESLVQTNQSLKQHYNTLSEYISPSTNTSNTNTSNSSIDSNNPNCLLSNLTETQENTLIDTELTLKKTKQDLLNAYNNPRFSKPLLQGYVPIITNTEKEELLKSWFLNPFALVLTYDSIIDGDSSSSFHAKCDGKVQTLTLIETVHGRRFGGFTKLVWDHSGSFKGGDEGAFVFSVDKKVKFGCDDCGKVIFCSDSQGPSFGKGPDIFVCDNFLSNDSTSILGGSFGEKEVGLGKLGKFTKFNYLAGIEVFRVCRVEVYQVIFV